jgi:UDP-glucose 4-epimerase
VKLLKVIVTGGEGFIGRNIINEANSKGWYTISVDIDERKSDANESHRISLLDRDRLREIFKGVDYVFHNAAVTSPPEFDEKPHNGFNTNVMGTFNILELSREYGVGRVILASSSSIYGNKLRKTSEGDVDTEFINLYPMTKFFNEVMARFYSKGENPQTVMLRYFNTYGVGENSKGFYSSVIHKFVSDINKGKTPVIFGDGSQSRDFIFVKDVANANILAATNGKNGTSYNVGTGTTTTFNDIFKIVKEEMKTDLKPAYEKIPFKSYQMYTCADISRLRQDTGFSPRYDLRRGIREIISV